MFKQVESGLILHDNREVPVLTFPELEADGRFVHGITTRLGGVSSAPFQYLNLSLSVDDSAASVRENRARAARSLDMDTRLQVRCRQAHGNTVAAISDKASSDAPLADALVTDQPGLALTMTFADCLPIILADASVPALGLVHAGWRGSVAGVALAAWQALERLGAHPGTTTAYLGPAIGPCCYQVGDDVVAQVRALGTSARGTLAERDGHAYLDLARLNGQMLEERGVRTVRSRICTACHTDLFYSHRAEAGFTGRFGVYVGLA